MDNFFFFMDKQISGKSEKKCQRCERSEPRKFSGFWCTKYAFFLNLPTTSVAPGPRFNDNIKNPPEKFILANPRTRDTARNILVIQKPGEKNIFILLLWWLEIILPKFQLRNSNFCRARAFVVRSFIFFKSFQIFQKKFKNFGCKNTEKPEIFSEKSEKSKNALWDPQDNLR